MLRRGFALSAVMFAVVAMPLRAQADVAGPGLPILQNCGPLPPLTETLPIEIRADGTLACSGRVMTLAELAVQLRTTAASHSGPRPAAGAPAKPVASRLHVLVRAAATVPFQAIAKVLQLCGRPDVLATQVHFGVRSVRDGSEGAFAYFLPSESRRDVPGRFAVTYAATGVAPTSLLGPMRRILAKRSLQPELSSIGLQLPGEAPLGDVLKLLDIAYSGGAGGVTMWVEPSAGAKAAVEAAAGRDDLPALVAACGLPGKQMVLSAGGKPLVNAPEAMPVAKRDGAFVGFTEGNVWVAGAIGTAEPLRRNLPPVFDPAGWYGNRLGQRRPGCDARTVEAIQRGLEWLVMHQDADGKWDADGFMAHDREGEPCDGPGHALLDVGVTGLALLAMLGDGNTPEQGPHRVAVSKGLRWLREQQGDNGLVGTDRFSHFIYSQAIATQVFVEAHMLTPDGSWHEPAQLAANYLEWHHNPYLVWGYQPRGVECDSSVTSWCATAAVLARYAGLETNAAALQMVAMWYDQVSDPTGKHGYSKQGEPSSRTSESHASRFPVEKGEAMTASGLFVRYCLGQSPKEKPVMKAATDLILAKPPVWDPKAGTIDFYYWFYGTVAMHCVGGREWASWWKALTAAVVKTQNLDGNRRGSWDPIDAWGEAGGRVYATAILVLSLEAPYRWKNLGR